MNTDDQGLTYSDNQAPSIKIVLLGDSGVGKTCIRSQYVHHIFTNAYKSTIGGDYLTSSVFIDRHDDASRSSSGESRAELQTKQKVNLQIWDTAGQERFNSISQAFYRGTDVAIFVYDITNYESVISIANWLKRFIDHCHVDKPGILIVGNKTDLTNERMVEKNEIRRILNQNTLIDIDKYVHDWEKDLMEISSKDLNMVNEIFERVASLGLQLHRSDRPKGGMLGFDGIDLTEEVKQRTSNCAC